VKLFNDDDPERLANFEGSVPDGFIDGSQYAKIVRNITGYISELKQDNYVSGITFVMKCVNECYEDDTGDENNISKVSKDRAIDTVTALSYFVLTLCEQLEEDHLKEYVQHHYDQVLPELDSNSQTIPYYDISNDVDNFISMLNEIDESDEDDNE
jgi:hypothetical protein